ncbi:hypothetical protein Ocin01_08317 [Orchesella cincta]|uniref:Uncharacterized protein n=1 Tax=Orchesella cincta TaxID=48709 RepID=A0A1D2MZE8_ORCCI|nr:hypothetical protein Ocin01_08317 [Orchesella cincta]
MSDSAATRNDQNIMRYTISTTWDGDKPADNAEIQLTFKKPLESEGAGLVIEVDAPFYNDPIVPQTLPIASTDKLWNYEVVEAFFLSESEGKYLEIELAPKGHYLLLQLDTKQNVLNYSLPLENYKATSLTKNGVGSWHGRAVIPLEYFPTNVNKFNAYAIHKSDPERVYMSLFPATKGQYSGPNFHRLNYFQDIDINSVLG